MTGVQTCALPIYKQAREITADGKVTVFLEDDADIGNQAEIVLLDATGQVIGSLATTLGN